MAVLSIHFPDGWFREQPLDYLLRNDDFEGGRCDSEGGGSVAAGFAVDLEGDGLGRAHLDGFACCVGGPFAATFQAQQEVDHDDDALEATGTAHDADIEQAIVALCAPGELQQAAVELRVADDDLQGAGLLYLPVDDEFDRKALEAEAQTDAGQNVAGDANSLQGSFFDLICDHAAEADTGHQQEVLVVEVAEVNTLHFAVQQHLACLWDVERNAGFFGPDVEGSRGQYSQCCLRTCQFLDDRVDRAVPANRDDYSRLLLHRLACQALRVVGGLCEPEFRLPAVLLEKCHRLVQLWLNACKTARLGIGYDNGVTC